MTLQQKAKQAVAMADVPFKWQKLHQRNISPLKWIQMCIAQLYFPSLPLHQSSHNHPGWCFMQFKRKCRTPGGQVEDTKISLGKKKSWFQKNKNGRLHILKYTIQNYKANIKSWTKKKHKDTRNTNSDWQLKCTNADNLMPERRTHGLNAQRFDQQMEQTWCRVEKGKTHKDLK